MGSVYEALDTKRNVHVALKSLGQIDPLTVSSFKAEFREFQHLHHPNLISLDELFSEKDEWHFSMELLTGQDFLAHVRRRGGPESNEVPTEMASDHGPDSARAASRVRIYPGRLDVSILAPCLGQLTAALSHLHQAGKVHRDVKSSNVIITDDGRTVLLDFGVSVDVKGKGVQLAGTPLYMAPELFWQSATPAADWYSVGVLLYQSLTGMDPWQGGAMAGLVTTKRAPPTHPSELDASIPEELGDLCLSLLAASPRERAGRRAILEWLDSAMYADGETLDDDVDIESEIFIGRTTEFSVLRTAFEDLPLREGPLVVFVQGESGIGKSALVRNFTDSLLSGDKATVLTARVLEEELVPYKSVDGIIDSLCEYFLQIGYEKVQPLLPEHFNIVADVFPVLRRSARVAELPRTVIPDPTERRVLMFAALKECLRRVAERTQLVLAVDDLQWSDADSLLFWNELVRGRNAPRALFVATLRTEQTGSLRPSRRPPSMVPTIASHMPTLPTPTKSIWLARLSESESMAYVQARRESSSNSVVPEDVIHEASGHPLFIDELLRYRGEGIGAGELTLDYVLTERIGRLEHDQRKYLRLVCVAAKPLPRVLHAKAAGLTHGEGLRAFKALREGRLVRTGRALGPDGDDWVDAFHYRVRNACLNDCSDDERAQLHRSLATTLEAEGRLDPEHLAIEWREAGETSKAAHYAELAANAAFDALAFQKAAEFYSDAITLAVGLQPTKERDLRERLGRSLRNAGKAKAAADAFLPLAERFDDARAFQLRCETVELLLRSGYIDEALAVARKLMSQIGESLPSGDRTALAALLWGRVRIASRRHKWRRGHHFAHTELRRLDALWSISLGLGSIEQLPSFALCARYVQLSLELGEPMRVARAFAMEALTSAAQNGQADAREYAAVAKKTAALVPEAAPDLAIVSSAEALALVMVGDWSNALTTARLAKEKIRNECVGAVGESSMAVEAELWALAATGHYTELYQNASGAREQAKKADDLYANIAASSGLPNLAWVAHDEAERAIEISSGITSRWSQRGVYLQHLFDAYARAQAHLYLGEPAVAADCFSDFDRRAKGKLILVPHMMKVFRAELEGRIALALQLRGASTARSDTGTKHLKKLRGLKTEWGAALGLLLEAGQLHAKGERRAAAALARGPAAAALGRVGMDAHRDVALAYAERLDGREPEQLDAGLTARGVIRAAAFAPLLVPGYDRVKG